VPISNFNFNIGDGGLPLEKQTVGNFVEIARITVVVG